METNAYKKAFITKCISSVKYRYYARILGENGFVNERKVIEEIANNEMEHSFALLSALGFCDCENFIEDMIESEKRQGQMNEEYSQDELLSSLSVIDKKHINILNRLLDEKSSEGYCKVKKCALCGFKDKSGKEYTYCPRCLHNNFLSNKS